MKRVVLESPYAGNVERNVRYAIACMKDCIRRDEAPFASHLLYPQCLDDNDAFERHLGILSGQAWGIHAEAVVVYVDLGISDGMKVSLQKYEHAGIPVEFRQLPAWESSAGEILTSELGEP